MHLVMPVFTFEGGRLVYSRALTLASTNLVKPCFNGEDKTILLITLNNFLTDKERIGVYELKRDPFLHPSMGSKIVTSKSSTEIFTQIILNLYFKDYFKSLYLSGDIVFRKENDGKLCLYKSPENVDITEN